MGSRDGHNEGALTVTVATADFEVSATLVATTWKVPGVEGAVYRPLLDTEPPPVSSTLHVTAVLDVPVTVAVNCCVPSSATVCAVGLMLTVTTGVALTVTVASAVFEVSATLVATT